MRPRPPALRISLLDPAGAAGNAWTISRGINNGAIRFERVADLQRIRLAGELFNNVTTFGQLLAAANAVTFISAEYFGGATAATLVISSNILIPPGNHLFLNGADGTPAVPEEAISATADAANRAILLRIRTTDTAGDIKAVVDAVDRAGKRISRRYHGRRYCIQSASLDRALYSCHGRRWS